MTARIVADEGTSHLIFYHAVNFCLDKSYIKKEGPSDMCHHLSIDILPTWYRTYHQNLRDLGRYNYREDDLVGTTISIG